MDPARWRPVPMEFEIDFLPVGNGDRSGDAIALRYGHQGDYKILVYDGGTKESGQALVDHIKYYYRSSWETPRVDYVVNSHPHNDHASGLTVVLEDLVVGELWMHRPWVYSPVIRDYFKDGRLTDNSLAKRLQENLAPAYELEQIANRRRIPIYEPFRGARIGAFEVLSPEKAWYVRELIPEFTKSPEPKEAEEWATLFDELKWILDEIAKKEAAEKQVSLIQTTWENEDLRDDVETEAENESSIVLWGSIDGEGILLTGDAGIRALSSAADFAESKGLSLPRDLSFIQVPHHGSRNNVSPGVLNRILGPPKGRENAVTTKSAVVSASEQSSTHPRRVVVNGFIRRGVEVIATKGVPIRFQLNMHARQNWSDASPLQFREQVESWD